MKKKRVIALICNIMLGISLAGCGGVNTSEVKEAVAAEDTAYDGGYFAENAESDYIGPDFNTEEYNHIDENGFLTVSVSPLSTFAVDVDTGSYTNFRRMVEDNYSIEEIPHGAIRTEEMLNYFEYDIPQADDDNTFAVAYEIGKCPWNEENKLL